MGCAEKGVGESAHVYMEMLHKAYSNLSFKGFYLKLSLRVSTRTWKNKLYLYKT
jgi:hypothetical protein